MGISYQHVTNEIHNLMNVHKLNLSLYFFRDNALDTNTIIKDDYDLVIFGDKNEIDLFKKKFQEHVREKFNILLHYRNSIHEKKPESPYIHLLAFENQEEFRIKEWPTVVNRFIEHHEVLNGSVISIDPIEIHSINQILNPEENVFQTVLEKNEETLENDYLYHIAKIIPLLETLYPSFSTGGVRAADFSP